MIRNLQIHFIVGVVLFNPAIGTALAHPLQDQALICTPETWPTFVSKKTDTDLDFYFFSTEDTGVKDRFGLPIKGSYVTQPYITLSPNSSNSATLDKSYFGSVWAVEEAPLSITWFRKTKGVLGGSDGTSFMRLDRVSLELRKGTPRCISSGGCYPIRDWEWSKIPEGIRTTYKCEVATWAEAEAKIEDVKQIMREKIYKIHGHPKSDEELEHEYSEKLKKRKI